MKYTEKVISLTGAAVKRVYHKINPLDCIVTQETLSKFIKVIQIGEQELGFDLDDLEAKFAAHISLHEDKEINIILNAHGSFNEAKTYCITTSARRKDPEIVENKLAQLRRNNDNIDKSILIEHEMRINLEPKVVEAKDLIEKLVTIAGNRSLKLFAICCYGENLLDFTNLLPPGSYIITLSNKYSITTASTIINEESEALLNHLFSSKFKIEYLIEACLLNQHHQQNIPKIGIKTIAGQSLIIDMADYAQSFDLTSNTPVFSEIFSNYLQKYRIDAGYIVEKLRTIQSEKNINRYQISDEEFQKIIDFRHPLSCFSKNYSANTNDIVQLIVQHYPFLTNEEAEHLVNQSEKAELGLCSFIMVNPTPLYALKMVDHVDFSRINDTSVKYASLFNLLIAAASDVMVSEDYIDSLVNQIPNQEKSALVGAIYPSEESNF